MSDNSAASAVIYYYHYEDHHRFMDMVFESLGESCKRALSSPIDFISEVSWKGLAWYCGRKLYETCNELAPSNLLGRAGIVLGFIGVMSAGLTPSPLIELTEAIKNLIQQKLLGKPHED